MGSLRDKTDEAFGEWLAGYAAGEGHFALPPTRGGRYTAQFRLGVRDDAKEVQTMLTIVERTGLGELYFRRPTAKATGLVSWTVQAKPECVQLAELFERYPICARKHAECQVWALGVRHWALHRRGDSWAPMAGYAAQLEALRAYDPVSPAVRDAIEAARNARRTRGYHLAA